MRALLIFASLLALCAGALPCPRLYTEMEGRCIRSDLPSGDLFKDDLQHSSFESYRNKCNADGAHLPRIRSDEDNESFNRIVQTVMGVDYYSMYSLELDAVCNETSRRFEWSDGSAMDYTPKGSNDLNVDCVNYTGVESNTWQLASPSDWLIVMTVCVIEADELPTVELVCAEEYQLMEGNRCIRPLHLWESNNLTNLLPKSRSECGKDGATLPVIKNDDENDAFIRIVNSFDEISGWNVRLVLDLVCNDTTRRLQWVDGSSIDYSPYPGVDFNFDCANMNKMAVSEVKHDDWQLVWTGDEWSYTVLCVAQPTPATTVPSTIVSTRNPVTAPTAKPGSECGDYSMMDSPLYTSPTSWDEAQKECAGGFGSLSTISSQEENKFLWRTAVSNGLMGGIHIGAHQPTENPKNWTWVDGETPIDGKSYDNFIGSFPIPGAGSCVAMLTESSSALWINEDCEEDALPFVCRRADFSSLPKTCPKDAPAAGEDFYPPGFPDAVRSCEYILFGDAKKSVEIEVKTLVAESNRDFLEVYEGPVGTNLLANLTGSILTTTKFATAKSNVMRVNWRAAGQGPNRGFRVRYNEVEP